MIDLVTDLAAFADERGEVQKAREEVLLGSAKYALRHYGSQGWYNALLDRAARLVREQYHADTNQWTSPHLRRVQRSFRSSAEATLKKTTKPDPEDLDAAARRIAASLATSAINAAIEAAAHDNYESGVEKVWVSQEDERVRDSHWAAHGQTVALGDPFTVGGEEMQRPGDMSAPIEEWINCRCLLGLVATEAVAASGASQVVTEVAPLAENTTESFGGTMANDDDQQTDAPDLPEVPAPEDRIEYSDAPIPFWGVLAPENKWSGDGRRFKSDALRARPLPLPLAYQKVNEPGHDGSFRVANIERAWRRDGLVYGMGHFLTTLPEVDEVVGVMAESGGRIGVSIDADDGEMEMVLRDGRTLEEALDEMEDDGEGIDLDDILTEFITARVCGATLCNIPAFHEAFIALGDVPDEFAPAEGEDLAIESRDEQAEAAAALAAAGGVKTEDGPGWLTHPVDTDRLRDYWVHGAGAAKIGWGTPGDFNRCRALTAQYVKPQHLSGYCANRHYDALGFWPGDHARMERGNSALVTEMVAERKSLVAAGAEMAPAISLVASAVPSAPPAEWFANPNLVAPSPIVVTEEGHFFGHLAAWGVCHIGIPGVCTEAPKSVTDYAYYRTGHVIAADGTKIPVGNITMDTGHANLRARPTAAMAHYDNTGTVVADVVCGEDDHGIWVSGAIRPGVDEEHIHALRAGALSGDWRDIRGNYELVAALVVNVPGYPIPHTAIAASGGRQTALVAAGIVMRTGHEVPVETVEEIVSRTLAAAAQHAAAKEEMAVLAEQFTAQQREAMARLAEESGITV